MIETTRIGSIRRIDVLQKKLTRNFLIILLISIAHFPLGLIIYSAGSFALLHPAATLGVGLYLALDKRYGLERVALAIAYLVGSEVLWRMAKVPVFWEFGKYGSALIVIVALIRRSRYSIPRPALAYFILLIPSCLLVLAQNDFGRAQIALSSNMTGPVLLVVCCWFFSYVKLNVRELRRLLLAVIIPLLSVAFATLFFTVTAEEIVFNTESNFATSGGFGPNQVSALLGLGVFVSLLCILVFQNSIRFAIYFAAAAGFFATQTVMTFSRGGIYNALAAALIVVIIELKRPAVIAKRLAPIAGVVILFLILVFPVLNQFTGGSLQERFEDTGTTNRAEIAESDINIFLENPVFGVGVGSSSTYRRKFLNYGAASHTEFSRLIAEHGIFGILALVSLIVMGVSGVMRQNSVLGRAVVAGAAAWSTFFMINTGMRLAAPSFIWGLVFVTIVAQRQNLKEARLKPSSDPLSRNPEK